MYEHFCIFTYILRRLRRKKIIFKTGMWSLIKKFFYYFFLTTLFAYLVTCTFLLTHSYGAESFAELFYHGNGVIKYQNYSTKSLVMLMAFFLLPLRKLMSFVITNDVYSSIR